MLPPDTDATGPTTSSRGAASPDVDPTGKAAIDPTGDPAGDPVASGDGGRSANSTPARGGRTPTGVGDRPLSDHGIERRQQIIEAAMGLFAERGYHAVRISDVCARAGIAKGLFYWYFDTKLDVFTEVARTMQRRLRRAQAAAFQPDSDALARIAAGTAASVQFMAEHASYFALIEVERTDADIRDALRAGSRVYLDDVTALIRQAQLEGTVGALDPTLAAIGVLGSVSAFTNALRGGAIDASTEEVAAMASEWVLRALGQSDTGR